LAKTTEIIIYDSTTAGGHSNTRRRRCQASPESTHSAS